MVFESDLENAFKCYKMAINHGHTYSMAFMNMEKTLILVTIKQICNTRWE